MSARITIKHLRPLVDRLNRTAGTSLEPWSRGEDGKLRSNIGNFHIDSAYGGYSLHQMANECGGIRDVFGVGHVSARALYDQIHAFLRGIEYGNGLRGEG
jgi:hypothetical protein